MDGDHAKKHPEAPTCARVVPATVVILKPAGKEGKDCLTVGQYVHLTDVIKRLAYINLRDQVADLSIEPISDFRELKEKGGILGRKNMRIYFRFYGDTNEVVVAKIRKEEEGQVSRAIIINVQDRLRKYRRGELRQGATVYTGDDDPRVD